MAGSRIYAGGFQPFLSVTYERYSSLFRRIASLIIPSGPERFRPVRDKLRRVGAELWERGRNWKARPAGG
jgi:hypothetical protein